MAISVKFYDANLIERPTCLMFGIGRDCGLNFFSIRTKLSSAKFNRDRFGDFVFIYITYNNSIITFFKILVFLQACLIMFKIFTQCLLIKN